MLVSGARTERTVRTALSTARPRPPAWPCPLPVIPPQPDAFHLAPHRIKRCTFRRLIDVEAGRDRVYDVECLFPDRKLPIPLGDLESATPICNACTAAHTFRPDED